MKFLFHTRILPYCGYGMFASEFIREFLRRGHDTTIRLTATSCIYGVPLPSDLSSIIAQESQAEDRVEIIIRPPGTQPLTSRAIYVTMWESSRLSPLKAASVKQARHVMVCNAWNVEGFRASGITRPIHRYGLGHNPEHYTPGAWPAGPFTFGAGGRTKHGYNRKGLDEIIQAFETAFPRGSEDVRLRLKLFPECQTLPTADQRIEQTRAVMTEEQVAEWFQPVHCWVSAARSEGWGLMQHQALAAGRPLISTRYSGIAEFFEPEMGWVIPHRIAPCTELWEGSGEWAEPDVDAMARAMREAFENQDEARRRGALAAERMKGRTWNNAAADFADTIEKIARDDSEVLP